MNRSEHYAEAERLLAEVVGGPDPGQDESELRFVGTVLQVATVHALLATAAAGVDGGGRFQTADGYCSCSRLAYQHKITPLCGSTPMPAPGGPMIASARTQVHAVQCLEPGHGPDVECRVPSEGPGQSW